jgi:hypothetical protein
MPADATTSFESFDTVSTRLRVIASCDHWYVTSFPILYEPHTHCALQPLPKNQMCDSIGTSKVRRVYSP